MRNWFVRAMGGTPHGRSVSTEDGLAFDAFVLEVQQVLRDPLAAGLTMEQREARLEALQRAATRINDRLIDGGKLSATGRMIAYTLKGTPTSQRIVAVANIDPAASMAEFVIAVPNGSPDPELEVAGDVFVPTFRKERPLHIFGLPVAREFRLWGRTSGDVRVMWSGFALPIRSIDGVVHTGAAPMRRLLARAKPRAAALALIERARARADRFAGCWLFADRRFDAGDNAEHQYRWTRIHHPEIKCGFILDRRAGDWARLEDEGFDLVAAGSKELDIALASAALLISSHADEGPRLRLDAKGFKNALPFRFVFLQHGTIKDDLSAWINRIDPALMITSSPLEYESIVAQGSNYALSEKQVKLTGMPRHDALVAAPRSEDLIFIMPTWRMNLVLASGSDVDAFAKTPYATAWRRLLNAEALKALSHRKRIVFCPHWNVAGLVESFAPPPFVERVDLRVTTSLTPFLAAAACVVTDYSSIAFDAALIDKPLVYFQFADDGIYEGGHISAPGYFDFGRDGFGPVAATEDEAFAAIALAIDGREDAKYSIRRRTAMPLSDGLCRQRTHDAMTALLAGHS